MPLNFWSELHAGRLDWVMRGYEEFVSGIDPELKRDYRRDDQITLVVYGPTQIGKTTLILNLLGIAQAALLPVAELLRGGQGSGRSATAAAVRYRQSPDECWYLGTGLREGLTDTQLCEQLGALRRRMENGQHGDLEVLDIHIPQHYFDAQRRSHLDVRLLDLPGLNAANATEREYVAALANRYVPLADLVILAVKADNLGALRPSALQLEGLKDWVIQPRRFRIVLTYSFTSQSFVEWFGQNPLADAGDVRERAYEQCCTHDYDLPEAIKPLMFPLEFGDSWANLQREKPDYFERARRIVDALLDELFDSLVEAASPYGRLKMVKEMHHTAKEKVRLRQITYDREQTELAKAIKNLDTELQGLQELQAQGEAQIQAIHARIETITSREHTDQLIHDLQARFLPEPFDAPEENTASLKEVAPEQLRRFACRGRACEADDQAVWSSYGQSMGAAPQPQTFEAFFKHLDAYLLQTYFPSVSSDFANDLKTLWKLCLQAGEVFFEAAATTLHGHRMAWLTQQQTSVEQLYQRVLRLQSLSARQHEQKDLAHEQLAGLHHEHELFLLRMEDAIAHSEGFIHHLQRAHRLETQAQKHAIQAERDPLRRLLRMALLELHLPEITKLMSAHEA
ncbi:MAG: hypothetical protein GAK43_01306 [Stenotrophomonas maltophilia]|nr:MAG: hypothetical protein GAK43_01306 [Stenotrophomonas maltophilia]